MKSMFYYDIWPIISLDQYMKAVNGVLEFINCDLLVYFLMKGFFE